MKFDILKFVFDLCKIKQQHFSIAIKMKPISVQTKDNWKLVVVFDNQVSKELDCASLLQYPAFAPLKDEQLFKKAFIDHNTVCWPRNLDLNPDWVLIEK
jgi:hypothetical protein